MSRLVLETAIGDTALTGIGHQSSVLAECALGISGSGSLPGLATAINLCLGNNEVYSTRLGVDNDGVTVLDKGDRATLHCLGDNVTNNETVRTTREATVSEKGDILSKASTHNGRRRLQHLRHTGATLGSIISDDNDSLLTLLDLTSLKARDEGRLGVVDTGLTLESETLLASDLTNTATRSKGSTENLDVTGRLNGVAKGANDGLILGESRQLLDVLLHGLASNSDTRAVNDTLLQEELEKSRSTTNLVHIGHDPLSRGLQVGKEGSAVGNLLEVLDVELDTDRVGNCDKMQNSVGAATKDGSDDHGILKGLASHDVTRSDIFLENVADSRSNSLTLGDLAGVLSRAAAATREGKSQSLNGSSHGVGSVHATTSTTTRAGISDNVESLLLGDLAGDVLTVGLESRDDIDRLALLGATGLNGTTVNHDAGTVDTTHGNGNTGHVLVATGQADVGVIPLTVHDSLNTIGNNLSALEGVSHTSGTHGDTIRDTDGVESVGNKTGLGDRLLDVGREVHKVHVARVSLVPDGRDANLSLVHVSFREAGGVEHSLGSTLGLGLSDVGGDLVELVIGADGGGRQEAAVMEDGLVFRSELALCRMLLIVGNG